MRPIIQILKGGSDLMPGLAPYFIRATISDAVGVENDSLEIELDDAGGQIPLPQEDDELTVLAGFAETGVALAGIYKVQGWSAGGGGGGPETFTMTARAASLSQKAKAGGVKHWDDQSLQDIFSDIASDLGLKLAIDPDIASRVLPWLARWEASPIDFATRLAAEIGAAVKPAGGRLAVVKRGSGRDASGADLPVIRVTKLGSGGWQGQGEPRPRFSDVVSSYHDPKDGKRKTVRHATGKEGPVHSILHPRASEDEAKEAAKAKARDLTMQTGSVSFTEIYNPAYSAGAFVEAVGFRDGLAGRWVSETIETTFDKDGGAISVINCKAAP